MEKVFDSGAFGEVKVQTTLAPSWASSFTKDELDEMYRTLSSGSGYKADKGKTSWLTIPFIILRLIAEVFTYGANKYKKDNWKRLDPDRLMDSGLRHLMAHQEGMQEENSRMPIDKESGYYHLTMATVNFIMVNYLLLKNETDPKPVDDKMSESERLYR
jgi:hypothetical protein